MNIKKLRWIVKKRKQAEKNPKKTMFGTVIILWLACLIIMMGLFWWDDHNTSWTHRGQFGDMFGVVNALFSGLAFGGIIITILLQKQELQLQRKELNATRAEFKTQNVTLKRQRFESTFFNMLNIHFKIIESLNFEYTNTSQTECLMEINRFYKNRLNDISELKSRIERWLDYTNADWELYQKAYKMVIDGHLSEISHYLQSLASLYQGIKDNKFGGTAERRYFQMLAGYISLRERIFLYYFVALSEDYALSIQIKQMEKDLSLMDSIRNDSLLHPTHARLKFEYRIRSNVYNE
jgi:hypothetical protein